MRNLYSDRDGGGGGGAGDKHDEERDVCSSLSILTLLVSLTLLKYPQCNLDFWRIHIKWIFGGEG
jgi:hypothetical protein